MHLYGVGAPPEIHPAGGDNAAIHVVNLAEEIVRLTVVTDATGEIIHAGGAAAAKLGAHEVGGILRYTLDA
jgi:hypothetical protein